MLRKQALRVPNKPRLPAHLNSGYRVCLILLQIKAAPGFMV